MIKKLSGIGIAFLGGALAMSAALAKPEIGKGWTVTCRDGLKSTSMVSLGYAICGCAKRGGSIEYPKFACSGNAPAQIYQEQKARPRPEPGKMN